MGFQLNKLERQLGQPGLAEQLGQGGQVQLFSQPVGACNFRWPWYAFSVGFIITVNSLKFRLFFSPPHPGHQSLSGAFNCRKIGRLWHAEIERLQQCSDDV